MEFNNRTILITGLIACSIIAMIFSYKDIALAIVSGLVGYLSKDKLSIEPNEVSVIQSQVSSNSDDVSVSDDEVSVNNDVVSDETA